MKPHPKIRKTVKWGGAAVSVLLLVVWVGSGWVWVRWDGSHWGAVVQSGVISFLDYRSPVPPEYQGWTSMVHPHAFPLLWSFQSEAAQFAYRYSVPLWAPLLTCILPPLIAWRLDTLARGRARVDSCPKCNYDRTGLAAGAVCPECGTAPKWPAKRKNRKHRRIDSSI